MSTETRGISRTNRFIAVPPFRAKHARSDFDPGLAPNEGLVERRLRGVSATNW